MKPDKHQRSKQRCQDLCWKVHDHVQSFVLCSYTMHELRNQLTFLLVGSSARSQLFFFGGGSRPKKRTKAYNKEL